MNTVPICLQEVELLKTLPLLLPFSKLRSWRSQRSEDHLRDLDQDVLKIEEVIKVVFNNLIVVKRNMAYSE